MNKSYLKFIFLLLLFVLIFSADGFSQSIKGDGNVVKETKIVEPFDKIELNGIVNVYLKQGENEKVEIETDKNLIPYIEIKSRNQTLEITTREKTEIKSSTKLNVYVTLKDLNEIELNSIGNLMTIGKLELNDLEVENNSIGSITLEINCNKLTLESNSIGNVTLSGNADNVDIRQNSIGNIKAFDLKADKLKIESNAVGNSEVYSEREIYITLNGTGNITYKGNAVVKALEKNGIGNIKKH